MANAHFTRLVNNARISLPGAIDGAIKMELFACLRDFLDKTDLWREDIEIDVVADEDAYDIVPSAAGIINRLMALVDTNDIPVGATMDIPGMVVLNITPSTSDTLTATVALNVKDPVDRDDFPFVPDWIMDKYNQGILHGVIARMMAQPAKPYTSAQLAIYHMREFRNMMSQAQMERLRTNLWEAQAWRFPKFA